MPGILPLPSNSKPFEKLEHSFILPYVLEHAAGKALGNLAFDLHKVSATPFSDNVAMCWEDRTSQHFEAADGERPDQLIEPHGVIQST